MARKKKTPGEDQPNESENLDDSFGLPDIEYKPLDRDKEEEPAEPEVQAEEPREYEKQEEIREEIVSEQPVGHEPPVESTYAYSTYETEERPSMGPKIIAIIAILLLVGAGVWYFASYAPAQKAKAEKARREEAIRQANDRKAAEAADNERQRQLAANQHRLDSLANLPKAGTIQTLNGRTGRYYVVIASDIDDDLLMDHAQRLSKKDISTKIIPPYGKYTFYRLSIDDEDTYASAQAKADELKGEYGGGLWVLHY